MNQHDGPTPIDLLAERWAIKQAFELDSWGVQGRRRCVAKHADYPRKQVQYRGFSAQLTPIKNSIVSQWWQPSESITSADRGPSSVRDGMNNGRLRGRVSRWRKCLRHSLSVCNQFGPIHIPKLHKPLPSVAMYATAGSKNRKSKQVNLSRNGVSNW